MRECDVPYDFLGIDSTYDRVPAQVKRTQSIEVPVPDAVRMLTSYGMIATGGFTLGFDDESPDAGSGIIRLVEQAGICLAMVGELYALLRTRLARRLEAEGRLFDQGWKTVDARFDVDQTPAGRTSSCPVRAPQSWRTSRECSATPTAQPATITRFC
jgi:hypothetical protein